MSFFDTVAGQDIKRLGSAGIGAIKDLGSYMLDNTFYGTGRDMDIMKGLGQYLMSPAPSQIDEIQATAGLPSSAPKVPINPLINIAASTPSPIEPSLFEKIKPPQALPNTSLIQDGAYTQNQISEILSDLPKAPQALPESPEMTQYKENIATDPKGGDKSLAGGAEAIEGLMNKSIMDYIDNIRGTSPEQAQKVKTLAKYKEEFAEATGLDVSGKPDTKDALVAFGLALMQNKAGKKFNVGNILKATGEAGEKAMPLLQKAKAEAKAAAMSAGKYALEMRGADKAKADAAKEKSMMREGYYILPKTGNNVENILNAEQARLNVFELNGLDTNSEFNEKYSIIPASQYNSVLKELTDTDDFSENFTTKPDDIPLVNNAPDLLKIQVFYAKPNKDGKYKDFVPKASAQRALSEINRMNSGLDRAENQIKELTETIVSEGATVFDQTQDGLVAFGRAIGVEFGDGKITPTQKIDLIFKRIQAQYAPQILQEAGKTISDADRKRVEDIVGGLQFITSQEQLIDKIRRIHSDIIQVGRDNVNLAYDNLQTYTDYDIGSLDVSNEDDISEEDMLKEILRMKKSQGV